MPVINLQLGVSWQCPDESAKPDAIAATGKAGLNIL
jgi:hypothetical protein